MGSTSLVEPWHGGTSWMTCYGPGAMFIVTHLPPTGLELTVQVGYGGLTDRASGLGIDGQVGWRVVPRWSFGTELHYQRLGDGAEAWRAGGFARYHLGGFLDWAHLTPWFPPD